MDRRTLVKQHIDRKLLFRLRLFLAVSFIMLLIIIYDIFQNTISLPLAAAGVGIGILTGLIAGRMFNVLWHEEKRQIIAKLDRTGIVILLLYIGFAVSRRWFFSAWIHGPALTAFTFALLGGSMSGRFLSTGFNIRNILYTRGVFK